jgi:hypothetical protein
MLSKKLLSVMTASVALHTSRACNCQLI